LGAARETNNRRFQCSQCHNVEFETIDACVTCWWWKKRLIHYALSAAHTMCVILEIETCPSVNNRRVESAYHSRFVPDDFYNKRLLLLTASKNRTRCTSYSSINGECVQHATERASLQLIWYLNVYWHVFFVTYLKSAPGESHW